MRFLVLGCLCLAVLGCTSRYRCQWDEEHQVFMAYDARSGIFVGPLTADEHDQKRNLGQVVVSRCLRYDPSSDLYYLVEDGRTLCYMTGDRFKVWQDSLVTKAREQEKVREMRNSVKRRQRGWDPWYAWYSSWPYDPALSGAHGG